MTKIVIDARESGTSTGRYIDKLIEHLYKLGPNHSLTILTKPDRVDYLKSIAPGFEVAPTTFKEFSLGEQFGFKKQIEKLQPDLVHFGMVQQPIWYKGRVVTTMHDLTTVRFRNPSKNFFVFTFKQAVYKWVNKKVARSSRALITPSEFVKQDVAKYSRVKASKITVTHEAADPIADAPEPVAAVDGKQFIMYVGRPLPHKNLERLIEAFETLQKTHPTLYLVLVGKKDELYSRLEEEVVKKGLKNVTFTGFATEGQLRWLYEHTACYVFPSLSEGFGLPGVEAMLHGAPVASSNATCLPEIYGNACAYFDPLDTPSIGREVGRVIDDETYAAELKKRGKMQAARYSWSKMAGDTLNVYEAALI